MPERHSTAPAKPHPEFPLFPHASGQWAKKIRGKLHYFGVWATPDAALDKYLKERDDLHAGRKPRQAAEGAEGLTVKEVVNAFLNARKALVDTCELSPRTWDGYKLAGDLLVSHFGKGQLVADLRPQGFADLRKKMAVKWGTYRLGNTIQAIRSVFKHAYDSDLIDRPIRFGPEFKKPSKQNVRLHRSKQGVKLFSADDIRKLIEAAGTQLKAMVLLGINAGMGNADCGTLPRTALDLDNGILDYPRPKTGMPRRVILWPETIDAIREAIAVRPTPKDKADSDLVFVTKYGRSWAKDDRDNPISKETKKLLNELGINHRRGVSFYCLRHTYRTIADETRDQAACDYTMGHEVPHMSSIYRERISDDRLRAVAEHVRQWLFLTKQVG